MDLPIGTVLLGKYRVDAILGIGGMGAVVRASHLFLAQPVAIKVLLPQFAQDPSTVQRFIREGQSAVQLRGEHIARVHDVGTLDDGRPFMVMEYLEGADLNQVLRAHGPQAPEIVADLMLQACEGIAEAHALGIVHRDIKPSNFFVTRMSDGEMLLKILDFGISKSTTELNELTGTQAVVGTPSYMAPEQTRNAKLADARSDQWSMGVVMYQLITGRVPFEADTYAELVLKAAMDAPSPIHVPLPAGLGEILFRCLEKTPDARFPNVAELARMLAPYSSDPMGGARSAERAMRILNVRTSGPSLFGANGELKSGITPNPLAPLTPRWQQGPSTNPSSVSGSAGQQLSQLSHARRNLAPPRRNLMPVALIGGCLALGIGGVLVHHAVSGGGDSSRVTSSPASSSANMLLDASTGVAPMEASVPQVAVPTVVPPPAVTIDAAVAVVAPPVAPAVIVDAAVAAVAPPIAPVVIDASVPHVVDAAIAVTPPTPAIDAGTIRKPFSNPTPPPTTPSTKPPTTKPPTTTPTTNPPPTKPPTTTKHHKKPGDDLFDDRH